MREIMALCDAVNQYIDQRKPWELAKHTEQGAELQRVCSTAMRTFAHLMRMLQPVLPGTAARALDLLRVNNRDWASIEPLGDAGMPPGHRIEVFPHLLARVDREQINALLEANREERAAGATTSPPISIEDFARVDLRLGKILSAEAVEGSSKLMKLAVDLGEPAPRILFSGIQAHIAPERLLGRTTVVVANLAPRKMRFGTSEGMLLTASDVSGATSGMFLLAAEEGARPGMKLS
jgi:methionyl-tRNA synthetase